MIIRETLQIPTPTLRGPKGKDNRSVQKRHKMDGVGKGLELILPMLEKKNMNKLWIYV